MLKKISAALIIFFILITISSKLNEEVEKQHNVYQQNIAPPFYSTNEAWADSILATLSLEEKIGQLFVVPAYSNKDEAHKENIFSIIEQYHIGGIIFFQGSPGKQIGLTNYFQSVSKIPLMIAIDGEWGLAMRLDSTINFPHQMMLGAITDERLIYEMGKIIGNQCCRVGVNVNFAPVIDINNNAANPVINSRSFGEDAVNVARKGYAYMKGMQDVFVLATAKHFPGHGDTESDSHHSLPIISHSRSRLDSVEIVPFQLLINAGLGAIMSAHLNVTALDSTPDLASSLSEKVITNLLRNELNFRGLAFTDALGMQGVSKFYKAGESDLKALMAGNDMLLMSIDIPAAFRNIKAAIENNTFTMQQLDERVKKILMFKKWAGLFDFQPISANNIYEDLHKPETDVLLRKLVENAITLLKNEENTIPIKNFNNQNIASLSIGSGGITTFQTTLNSFGNHASFSLSSAASPQQIDALLSKLQSYHTVIVSLHSNDRNPPTFGVSSGSAYLIQKLSEKTNVILAIFASPYTLNLIENNSKLKAIVVAYENSFLANKFAAQIIAGNLQAKGILPVSVNNFPVGTGVVQNRAIRLKYSIPLQLLLNDSNSIVVDTLINNK